MKIISTISYLFLAMCMTCSIPVAFSKIKIKLKPVVKKIKRLNEMQADASSKAAKIQKELDDLPAFMEQLKKEDAALVSSILDQQKVVDRIRVAYKKAHFHQRIDLLKSKQAAEGQLNLLKFTSYKKYLKDNVINARRKKTLLRKLSKANHQVERNAKKIENQNKMFIATVGDECAYNESYELIAGSKYKGKTFPEISKAVKHCKQDYFEKKRSDAYYAARRPKVYNLGKSLSEMAINIATSFNSLVPQMRPGEKKVDCINPDAYADIQKELKKFKKLADQYEAQEQSAK